MSWKAGEKILYHDTLEAILIKPMTPFGFKGPNGVKGQLWELRFDNRAETDYRWLYPNIDCSVQKEEEEKKQ